MNTINSIISPLPDVILTTDIEKGEKITKSGLIILDDDMKNQGIRPRWSKVWKVGKNITGVEKEDWVLVEHGRWTREITMSNGISVRMIEESSILLKTKEYPL